MKVNNDKAFEWKRVWVIVGSFKVYSFLSSFKTLIILIESKRIGGILKDFKWKRTEIEHSKGEKQTGEH